MPGLGSRGEWRMKMYVLRLVGALSVYQMRSARIETIRPQKGIKFIYFKSIFTDGLVVLLYHK